MENAAARPRYARRPVQSRHRRKPARGSGGIMRTIVRQFVICALLLVIVCIVKGVHFSAADYITDKVKYVISYNVELKTVFAYVEKLALEIRDSIAPSNSGKSEAPETSNPTATEIQGTTQTPESAGTQRVAKDNGTLPAQTAESTQNSQRASAENTATLSSSMDGEKSANMPDQASTATGSIEAASGIAVPSMPETSVLSATSGTEPVVEEEETGMLLPVEGTLISHFGQKGANTADKNKEHNGIDIDVSGGVAVLAALDGKVTETGSSPSYGTYIRMLHADGIQTIYANCSEIAVKKGDIVKKGDRIAEIGGKGISVGVHLHFEVWKDGVAADPLNYIRVPEI